MKCIRCGRTLAEGNTFCDECLKEVGQPLEESQYLSTRVTLPNRAKRPVRRTEKRTERRKETREENKAPRPKKLIRATVILSLLCLMLAAACGYGLTQYQNWHRDRNRLRVQQEEYERLSAELEKTQQSLSEAEAGQASLREELSDAKRSAERLEEDINSYRVQSAEVDLAVRELQSANLRLTQELQDAEERADTLDRRLSNSTQRISELNSRLSELQEKSDFVDEHIAFVENDRTKYYHRYECTYFKKQSYWAFGVTTARARGYTPCPYCQPDE